MTEGWASEGDDYPQNRTVDGWVPKLLLPEALTSLPIVDQALPIVCLFAGLVGQGRLARYRVAILRELSTQPHARLTIRAIQQSIAWMEPTSVSRLVQDLRDRELLIYDSRTSVYQLTREARVVAAICGALTAAAVDYARVIKILSATMRLADAMNAPSEAAYATFLSAIAVLESDFDELRRLLDDFSEDALREAAMMAGGHVGDMRALIEEQADMFARFHGDPLFLEHDQRAHHMIASLSHLADEVVTQLSRRADLRLRGALRVDRRDLQAVIENTTLEELADIVASGAMPPVFLPAVNAVAAFTALDDYLGRSRQHPLPPPVPETLEIVGPGTADTDPVAMAVAALESLGAAGNGMLSDWVVSDTWSGALNRNVHATEAWARYGPSGDQSLNVLLDPRPHLLRFGHSGVGWASSTVVKRRSAGGEGDTA